MHSLCPRLEGSDSFWKLGACAKVVSVSEICMELCGIRAFDEGVLQYFGVLWTRTRSGKPRQTSEALEEIALSETGLRV